MCKTPYKGPFASVVRYFQTKLGYGGAKVMYPQDDLFYGYNTPASDLTQAPGTILRTRSVKMKPFFGLEADKLQVWQIAYTTRGPFDAQVTVCTVVVPPNAGDRSKVVVQCAKTDSASPVCRTSYNLLAGIGSPLDGASEQVFMELYLDRGYIVIVPDYEGQKDAFGCGVISGNATLDSIRATLSFTELNLPAKEKLRVVVWGYSGGAIACSWAAQSIATYAPELQKTVCGFSMGGVPADLLACAMLLNDSIAAGLIIGIFQGLANSYPEVQTWIDNNTTKKGKAIFHTAKNKYFASFMKQNFLKDVLNIYPSSFWSFRRLDYFTTKSNPIMEPVPLKTVKENSIGTAFEETKNPLLIPKIPIYIYEAISDYVVPIATVDKLVDVWTKNGANITYDRIKFWLHVGTIFANASENVQWIADRLDGKPTVSKPGKCVTSTVEREIADDGSKECLSSKAALHLEDHYNTVYKATNKPWW